MSTRTHVTALVAVLAGTTASVGLAAGDLPFRGSTSSFTRYASSGRVPVDGHAGIAGYVRARFILPAKWRRDSSLNSRSIRLDTRNSCHHKVAFRSRFVEVDSQSATQRVRTLLPATGAYVRAYGTRESAAFRVIRDRGSDTVRGVLTQPITTGTSGVVPAGKRLFAEIVATGRPDKKLECHSGGPRTVADAIGDGFAAGGAGGFLER